MFPKKFLNRQNTYQPFVATVSKFICFEVLIPQTQSELIFRLKWEIFLSLNIKYFHIVVNKIWVQTLQMDALFVFIFPRCSSFCLDCKLHASLGLIFIIYYKTFLLFLPCVMFNQRTGLESSPSRLQIQIESERV